MNNNFIMIDKKDIPRHVAIIMDGNGRWAEMRNLPRTEGHRVGSRRVREIVKESLQLGIKVLTIFAFSEENWDRPKKEINILMRLLSNFLDKETEELNKNNIRFKVIGRREPLPKSIISKLEYAKQKTKDNTAMTLVLALNYGGRQEIIDAVKEIADKAIRQRIDIEDLDVDKFNQYLYTKDLPEPDLLIRTSGEMRISNFLLWQLSYTELYFCEKFWPDFGRNDLQEAIIEYKKRERRFGKTNAD